MIQHIILDVPLALTTLQPPSLFIHSLIHSELIAILCRGYICNNTGITVLILIPRQFKLIRTGFVVLLESHICFSFKVVIYFLRGMPTATLCLVRNSKIPKLGQGVQNYRAFYPIGPEKIEKCVVIPFTFFSATLLYRKLHVYGNLSTLQ